VATKRSSLAIDARGMIGVSIASYLLHARGYRHPDHTSCMQEDARGIMIGVSIAMIGV